VKSNTCRRQTVYIAPRLSFNEAQAVAVACGGNHSLALLDNGRVLGWGSTPELDPSTPPEELISGTVKATAIAAGANHSVALLTDGSVAVWGDNLYGQMNVPREAVSDVRAICSHYNTIIALRADGSVIGWGDDFFGQATPPEEVGTGARAIACSTTVSYALMNDGTVMAWGELDSPVGDVSGVTQLQGVSAIAAGSYHVLALLDTGVVRGFGENNVGQVSSHLRSAMKAHCAMFC
jgi:alpha-tubulin suppressor-like RCC1 family protein